MAGNKKIFDLPLRTGVTADDRLAIVDSGNTATYSVKLSDLQDGTGVNSLAGLTGDVLINAGTGMNTSTSGGDTITFDNVGVLSLESLTGDITFSGTNIDITTSGQTIYFSGSTGGGGGSSVIETTSLDAIYNKTGTGLSTENIYSGTTDFVAYGYGNNSYNNSIVIGADNTSTNNVTGENLIVGLRNINWRTGIAFGKDNNFVCCGADGVNIGLSNTNARGVHMGKNNIMGSPTNNGGGVAVGASNSPTTNSYSIFGTSNTGRGIILGQLNNSSDNQVSVGSSNNVSVGNSTTGWNIGIGRSNIISGGVGQTSLGNYNDITSTGNYNSIIGGFNNTITGTTSGTTILGLQNYTSTKDDMVYLPALTLVDYASYNFADDAAAATGGVELGGIYHNAGALRVRIT